MASLFTQIINGDLPGHVLYQDERCFAIMNLFPCSPGHLLVIPFEEIDHWDDMPDDLTTHVMLVAKKIAHAQKQVYQTRRVGILVSGMDIPHVHIHLIPANTPADLDLTRSTKAEETVLADAARRLSEYLA